MEAPAKAGIVIGALLLGIILFSSFRNKGEEVAEEIEEGEEGKVLEPTLPPTKIEQLSGGTIKVTSPTGEVKILTPAQQKVEAKEAVKGRGADGSVGWSNATGFVA